MGPYMKNFGGETLSKTHPKTLSNGNPTHRVFFSPILEVLQFWFLKQREMTLVCLSKKVASDFTFLVAFYKPKNLKWPNKFG